MSATATYQQFLAAPNSSLLAANASLHYITTTTSLSGPTDIIKHFNTLRNQVKKKKEDILDAIEGQNALVVVAETTLEFITSGGVYLPGLDDNFLADRTVYIPIVRSPLTPYLSYTPISVLAQKSDQDPTRHISSTLTAMVESLRSGRPGTRAPCSSRLTLLASLVATGRSATARTSSG